MRALTLLILLALLASQPLSAQPGREARIDKVFSGWRSGPGGCIGVVVGDRLVFARGYGLADVARKIPNTPQTVYDLASVSKQFTATAVLLQAQAGKLSLGDGLGKFLPNVPGYAANVSLEKLLNMTSGLPDYDDSVPVSESDLVEVLASEKPTFKPGARYEYLNMNYALLTFVVQRVAGQKLGQVLQSRIFGPLKMTHTTFLGSPKQVIEQRAIGYKKSRKSWVVSRNDVPGVGDGNVFSSVQDLSLWARDLLRGSSILQSQWQTRAWTSGVTSDGKKTDYGLGFEIDEHRGRRRISHSGSWMGSSTYIALYPQRKLAVIVLSNRENEDCNELGERVENLYLP